MRLLSLSLIAGGLIGLAVPVLAAAPSDIMWDTPAKTPAPQAVPAPPTAPPGSKATIDSTGITWDGASKASPAPSAPPAASASANSAPADSAGIVWNTPGKPAAKAPPPPASAPAQVSASLATPGQGAPGHGECREFQTTIVIDGQKQPAHGTVCRQPDGTWRVVNN